jgi:hypothetical protein
MALAVRYSDLEEFVAEVTDRASEVQEGLVRTTCSMQFVQPSTYYYLTAGAVIGNMLVELRQKCGVALTDADHTRVKEHYLKLRDRLVKTAEALGLKVRAGFWIEVCGNGGWR